MFFGPFEFLSLFIFLGSSFIAFAMIGSSPYKDGPKKWYRELWYPSQSTKINPFTLLGILVLLCLDLGFTGWGAWVTPIQYTDVSNDSEAQELISVWNETRVFWKFVLIMSLHLASLFVMPLWVRTIFAWKSLKSAFALSVFQAILAALLTIFGYLYYWPVGIGYSVFFLIALYLMVHSLLLLVGKVSNFPKFAGVITADFTEILDGDM
jgi:hypothetical protein